MEPLYWLFIRMALILSFVVFAVNPMQAAIDDAIQHDARLQAERLASTINMMVTAPEGARYSFEMPRANCRVTITKGFVKMTIMPVSGGEITNTIGLIKTDTPIKGNEFECRTNRQLELRKGRNFLEII